MATVLIVDDRPTNREFLVTLLGYMGHRLLEAGDGAEALVKARDQHPDLIITDILMPTMDGFEFVRRLRADGALQRTPVIFCTAHFREREAQGLAKSCGVSHILTKPCEPEVVVRTVEAALGLKTAAATPSLEDDFDREHLQLLKDKLAQKMNELRVANERLDALVNICLQLASERDPERLLESFCKTARELVGAKYAGAGVMNSDKNGLGHFHIAGLDQETAGRIGSFSARRGILGEVLAAHRTVRQRDLPGDPEAVDLPPEHPPVHSFLAAPIISPSKTYGWIYFADKVGLIEFTEEDERLAGILGAQVGRIYENGALYGQVVRHAADLHLQVAERREAEEALRRSEERYRALFESSPQPMWIYDLETLAFLNVNDAAVEHYGYARNEFLAMTILEIRPADEIPALLKNISTKAPPMGHSGAWKHRKKDGKIIDVEVTSHDFHFAGRATRLVLANDITERKRLEEQLRQSQKMEAIGRLAGGVAHDFNNMLTVISGYSEIMLASIHPEDPLRECAEQVKQASERAAALTRQLLAFSRKQMLVPVVLDLNALLDNLQRMLPRLIGEDIELQINPKAGLWRVKVDPGQMEQVIMNLVVNAKDAMLNGGKLTIETCNCELDETFASKHPVGQPGQYVMLAVSDTGTGMDETTQAKIFEPFFTTKAPEKGTGLGLATVYGIVQQSGGRIEVYSEVGTGTTFKIYLPRATETGAASKSNIVLPRPDRGTETVLLVEDADAVRILARTILQYHGYTVLEARNGGEALLLCRQHRGPIHLMVADVVMPNMSGTQLAEHLVDLRPEMKVLYISGYTNDAMVHHGVIHSETAFLHKPFTADALARKVREVLEQPKPLHRA